MWPFYFFKLAQVHLNARVNRAFFYLLSLPVLEGRPGVFPYVRASNEGCPPDRALREHRESPGFPHFFFPGIGREWPRMPSTARIERAHSDCVRSASKEGTWSVFFFLFPFPID